MVGWRRPPFLRAMDMSCRESGAARLATLHAIDHAPADVVCRVTVYPSAAVVAPHRHARHQLIHAVRGLMVVGSGHGRWVVPSTRAIWMPAGIEHGLRCIGEVHMHSLYVWPRAVAHMPAQPAVVEVVPLLRELIHAAARIAWTHAPDSRDGRVMQLVLDELQTLPALPLHLPEPTDPRLQEIFRTLEARPGDPSTLADWAARLGHDARTLQRLFRRELAMSFGQWRQQVRLLRGLERLAAGEKVIDVALALGYDSPSAFTAMFRRQLGQPPSRFFG